MLPSFEKHNQHQMSSAFNRTLSPPWMLNSFPSANLQQPTTPPIHLGLPSIRYPGDGLDCRIPIMSVPTQEIIDLTDDSSSPRDLRMYPHSPYMPPSTTVRHSLRPPRRVRDVISIDDVDDRVGLEANSSRRGSPEIEVLFARSRLPSARQRQPPTDPEAQPSVPPSGGPVVDLELDSLEDRRDEDNLANWRSRIQQFPHPPMPHAQGHLEREFAIAHLRNYYRDNRHQLPHGHLLHQESGPGDDVMFMTAVPQINLPGSLDFRRQGFAMGPVQQTQPEQLPNPPPPTYEAPPPPRLGYSRSPKEDDVLICPNCEDELGMGKDDTKRQVWVAKKCGHVSLIATPLTRRAANVRHRCIAGNVPNIGSLLQDPRLHGLDCPNPFQHVQSMTVTIKSVILRVFSRSIYDSQSTEDVNLHSARRWVSKDEFVLTAQSAALVIGVFDGRVL